MENPSYDINAVKKYFFYYAYRKVTRSMNELEYEYYTKKPYFLLSEKIGGLLFMSLSSLFTLFNCFALFQNNSVFSISLMTLDVIFPTLLIYLFLALIAYFGVQMYRRAHSLESLNRYFLLKEQCIQALNQFEASVSFDILEKGINPLQMEQIWKIIRIIESTSKILLGPFLSLQKLSNELKNEQKEVLEQFNQIEYRWFQDYIIRFESLLTKWLSIHASEIADVENSLSDTSTQSIVLATKRLELQRTAIEKTKVLI